MLDRRRLLQAASAAVAAAAWPALSCSRRGQLRDESWNVLFLIADDLNDWVSFLGGYPAAKTPNLDRLAAQGTIFTNAHCAAPCCGGSRTSVMLGLDPTTTGVYVNHQDYAETRPEAATLPLHFKRNGYWTGSTGKVFHVAEQRSWSERFAPEVEDVHQLPRVTDGDYGFGGRTRFDWGPVEASDNRFHDWRIGEWVIAQLAQEREEPFFLAAGFGKPHLPWMVPKEYFDPFPPAEVQLPVARPIVDRRDIPSRARGLATHGRHRFIVESGQWERGVSAYLASMYFVDSMIGRVLEALQRSVHAERTIVVFWSDHGFHLGEKSHWGKFALWEESTRVPLIVSIPGRKAALCARPVSLTSLFPTLANFPLRIVRSDSSRHGQYIRSSVRFHALEPTTINWRLCRASSVVLGGGFSLCLVRKAQRRRSRGGH